MPCVDYLDRALSDAEQLLAYAAETGIDVDGTQRDAVLMARSAKGFCTGRSRAAGDAVTGRMLGAVALSGPPAEEAYKLFDTQTTGKAVILPS